jgi:hypothetical protein
MLMPFLLAAVLASFVSAEPCLEHPTDYTIVQFTSEECRCCFDLDEFIADHDYVYVLFYSTKGRLNIDINAKFEQLAADWKWSRIHFGRIDVDKDREMAKKWNEPHMVPTNIMYKYGRPIEVMPKDFEQVRDKYAGNPEGQKWMVTKYMGEDADGTNLHYVTPIMSAKKKKKFVKTNEVAIIGFFKREMDFHHKVYCEAVWKLYQDINRDDLGSGTAAISLQTLAKKEKAQVPSITVYLDGKPVEDDGTFTSEKWSVKEVAAFIQQFLPLGDTAPMDSASTSGTAARGEL